MNAEHACATAPVSRIDKRRSHGSQDVCADRADIRGAHAGHHAVKVVGQDAGRARHRARAGAGQESRAEVGRPCVPAASESLREHVKPRAACRVDEGRRQLRLPDVTAPWPPRPRDSRPAIHRRSVLPTPRDVPAGHRAVVLRQDERRVEVRARVHLNDNVPGRRLLQLLLGKRGADGGLGLAQCGERIVGAARRRGILGVSRCRGRDVKHGRSRSRSRSQISTGRSGGRLIAAAVAGAHVPVRPTNRAAAVRLRNELNHRRLVSVAEPTAPRPAARAALKHRRPERLPELHVELWQPSLLDVLLVEALPSEGSRPVEATRRADEECRERVVG